MNLAEQRFVRKLSDWGHRWKASGAGGRNAHASKLAKSRAASFFGIHRIAKAGPGVRLSTIVTG